MTEQTDSSSFAPEAATPEIKQHRSFSIVWIVPVVALLIGVWLVYKAVSEKGPTITITFKTAEGLEAGKTKVKFKDVEVGNLQTIDIAKDLSHVKLTVQMQKGAEKFLTEKTQFWVVRARVGAGQVTGLGTLFSGAYIGIIPAAEGKSKRHFEGLEKPPIVTGEVGGKTYELIAPRRGSLNPGSPIYFRQIKVGEVVDYALDAGGSNVGVQIFIQEPYHKFVRQNTRFWVASGLDVNLTANGLQIDTESVTSLLIGGLAFSTFPNEAPQPEAEKDAHFKLYETRKEARDDRYRVSAVFYIEFKDSVRGLSVGAPVEFQGLQIGQVVDIELKADFDTLDFSIPVRVEMQPERMSLPITTAEEQEKRFDKMVNKGFRAQLKTGSLLTGQLFVDLKYLEDAPPGKITYYKGLKVIPSVPSSSQEIMQGVSSFVKKLDALPLEDIGRNLDSSMAGINRLVNDPALEDSIKSLRQIMTELETTTQTLNADTVPKINAALDEMDKVIKNLDGWVSPDAPLKGELSKTLRELSAAAQAISDLADMLDRHPESLIQGKRSSDQ
jgi:paraquat-inducible protein B